MKVTRHALFVGYVALMLVAFFAPVPAVPASLPSQSDKLVHFLIFLGFALLLRYDRRPTLWTTLLLSLAFAGTIELLQSFLSYRTGDWQDFAAGAAGAAAGVAVSRFSRALNQA